MRKKTLLGWLFILPAVLLITLFLIYPTIRTVQLSFYSAEGFTAKNYQGLENYKTLFTKDRFFFQLKPKFQGAVRNTILWLLVFTPGTVGFGLLIAVLANSVKYEVLVKTIIFIPMGISFTAAGIIWRFVYSPDPDIGVLNAIVTTLSPGTEPIAWLGKTNYVNFAIIAAGIWIWTGFCLVVISAALKGLPQEVIEAARVDGAGGFQTFLYIIFPMLRPTLIVVATTMVINVLKAFDLVFIMTSGGPRGASRIIGFTMYWETFNNGRIGYGSAVAVIMLLLILPVVLFNIHRFRGEEQNQ